MSEKTEPKEFPEDLRKAMVELGVKIPTTLEEVEIAEKALEDVNTAIVETDWEEYQRKVSEQVEKETDTMYKGRRSSLRQPPTELMTDTETLVERIQTFDRNLQPWALLAETAERIRVLEFQRETWEADCRAERQWEADYWRERRKRELAEKRIQALESDIQTSVCRELRSQLDIETKRCSDMAEYVETIRNMVQELEKGSQPCHLELNPEGWIEPNRCQESATCPCGSHKPLQRTLSGGIPVDMCEDCGALS